MRILIVKLSSLGDVIQTMAVVPDLRAIFPHAQIDWVVEEAFAPLVAQVEGLSRVLPIGQRRWRKAYFSAGHRAERVAFHRLLQQEAYDAVIDFQGLVKSAWVAAHTRLRPLGFRATYANASQACAYEWPVHLLLDRMVPMPARIHAVARYRLLAARALHYDKDPLLARPPQYRWEKPAAFEPLGNAPLVVLAHGTTRADNEWPEEDWLALGRQLIDAGMALALPHAGAQELARVQRWAQALGPQAHIWPQQGLDTLAQAMAASAGVIGVDSGLSHLAVALGLPHVQIFSQDRAWRAGPQGCSYQVAVGGAQAPTWALVWQVWQQVQLAHNQAPCA